MVLTAVTAGVIRSYAFLACVPKALALVALSGLFGWSEGLVAESFFVNYDAPSRYSC